MHYNHSFYLYFFDVSGISLILVQLAGIENYAIWSCSMHITLLGRNKMKIIDGTLKKEKFREELWGQWEKVNIILLSWIMNIVSSNILNGIVYAYTSWCVYKKKNKGLTKLVVKELSIFTGKLQLLHREQCLFLRTSLGWKIFGINYSLLCPFLVVSVNNKNILMNISKDKNSISFWWGWMRHFCMQEVN